MNGLNAGASRSSSLNASDALLSKFMAISRLACSTALSVIIPFLSNIWLYVCLAMSSIMSLLSAPLEALIMSYALPLASTLPITERVKPSKAVIALGPKRNQGCSDNAFSSSMCPTIAEGPNSPICSAASACALRISIC